MTGRKNMLVLTLSSSFFEFLFSSPRSFTGRLSCISFSDQNIPKKPMDYEELELWNRTRTSNLSSSIQGSAGSFLDEFLKNASSSCTHTHTCNPPGPDTAHTHTCYHAHAHVLSSAEDSITPGENLPPSMKPKRPSGNREAVRKYRKKKKAHAAYLEEEVKKLRFLNQELVRKLQRQAILEAENLRLRSIFVDIGGKIDKDLGGLPFKKQCHTDISFREEQCGVVQSSGVVAISLPPCQTNMPCFYPSARGHNARSSNTAGGIGKLMSSGEGNCESAVVNCQVNAGEVLSAADFPYSR